MIEFIYRGIELIKFVLKCDPRSKLHRLLKIFGTRISVTIQEDLIEILILDEIDTVTKQKIRRFLAEEFPGYEITEV